MQPGPRPRRRGPGCADLIRQKRSSSQGIRHPQVRPGGGYRKAMARVCVVGSVNMDLVFTVDTLPPPGATVLASQLTRAPGGKGGNQAVAAARAGAEVVVVAAVGDDDTGTALR